MTFIAWHVPDAPLQSRATSFEFALLHADLVDSTALKMRLGNQRMATVWQLHDRQSPDQLQQIAG